MGLRMVITVMGPVSRRNGREFPNDPLEDPNGGPTRDHFVETNETSYVLCPGEHQEAPGYFPGIYILADASFAFSLLDELDSCLEEKNVPATHLIEQRSRSSGHSELEQRMDVGFKFAVCPGCMSLAHVKDAIKNVGA